MASKNRNRIHILAILLLVITVVSCTVSYKFSGASISSDAKSVSVAFFNNEAALVNPNLSQKFTESLKDYMVQQARLPLVTRDAHLQFEGEFKNYELQPMAITENATSAETRLNVTVNVRFINTLNEKENFETQFVAYSDFPSEKSLSEVEDELTTKIIKQLCEDIFNKAFSNW